MRERSRQSRAVSPNHTGERSSSRQPSAISRHDGRAATIDAAVRSSARPLETGHRSRMENAFGHDFGDVRVHTDARAQDSAQAMGALAYTVGTDIVFAAGEYSPGSESGDRLLAHELAHVVQQQGVSFGSSDEIELGELDGPAEREAKRAAEGVTAGESGVLGGSPTVSESVTPGVTVQPYIANPDLWKNMPSLGDLDIMGGIGRGVAGAGAAYGSGVSRAGGVLGRGITGAGGLAGSALSGIGGGIGSALSWAGGAAGRGAQAIGGLFGEGSVGESLGNIFGGAISDSSSVIGGAAARRGAELGSTAGGIGARVGGAVSGGASAVGSGISSVAGGIGGLLSGLGDLDPSWLLM